MKLKNKIGMVTIGQTPRADFTSVMDQMAGGTVEVLEKGALDGLSLEAIQDLAPQEGMTKIVTRLTDGSQVVIGEEKVIPRIQAKITELNNEQVELIVLLCTGQFPTFQCECLLMESQKVVDNCIAALVKPEGRLGVLIPLPEQMEHARQNLSHICHNIVVASVSPYGPIDAVVPAAETLRQNQVDLIVMHCMGYTNDHRKMVRQNCKCPVIVSSSIVARTVAELLQS